jgi:hypothetical protein
VVTLDRCKVITITHMVMDLVNEIELDQGLPV